MAYWAGGGAGGWSQGNTPNQRRGRGSQVDMINRRGIDGWDYDELGKVYDLGLIKRLLPFITPHKWKALGAIISMIIFSAASYAPPFIMALAIERIGSAIIEGTPESLDRAVADTQFFGIVVVVLAVVMFFAAMAQRLFTGYIGHHMLRDLRSDMFAHLNKLSLSFYDREEVGRLMSRVTSDVVTLQELMTSGFLNVLADIIGLIIIIVLVAALDPVLAILALIVVPILFFFMLFWQKFAARAFIRVRQAIAIVNANINENVSGVRVVQSMVREPKNFDDFEKLNNQNKVMNLKAAELQASVMPVVEILSATATCLVLFVIGYRAFNGVIDAPAAAGLALGFTLYIQRFFNPVRDIVLQYTMLQRAMAGAHRIFEVLDTQPEIIDPPEAIVLADIEGRVDFCDVDFSYIVGIPVLEKFDLHVSAGETIALVGHTGAGKTSVTALVNRSYDIQQGEILIDGHDLRSIQRASLTSRMSVVLQEPYLFSGSIRDNIRYGRLDATDEEVEIAAKAVGADEFISQLPEDYSTLLHERGRNVSVGQRQLIAFARALVADPRILILDEATANVDTQTEKLIQRALETMLQGRTSFVIAHRLSTIRNADRIVMMQSGKIVEIGNHDELMQLDGAYADLYKMTFANAH
ncbi:MAG: ABC transporter ATP-binding protein/permease [Dehalococcoidia bacterium]|nr:ABC transporter ATP-binding protein/permease [Dehalococcoidia bacterium]